ncbi:Clp protease N-terminal domain-containing protein [Nocardia goodfellowii]
MPKINVYVPDELAEAIKVTGVPVSAICQRALEQSVRRVTAIRATVLGDLDSDDPTAQLARFTDRTREVIRLAIEQARIERGHDVGTEHLLHALLAQGTNLAVQVLRAMEVDPAQVQRALAAATSPTTASTTDSSGTRFSGSAANAFELTVTEAMALGHNYVGCEHLLLGLIGEPDGIGGQVLRDMGIDLRSARRAVVAALAGYTHLRAQSAETATTDASAMIAAVVRAELRPVLDRIERLEQRSDVSQG